MAFINTGKNRGFFHRTECNYGRLLSEFFGSSCAPGARDSAHDPNITNPDSLCALCRSEINASPPPISVHIPPILRGLFMNNFKIEFLNKFRMSLI